MSDYLVDGSASQGSDERDSRERSRRPAATLGRTRLVILATVLAVAVLGLVGLANALVFFDRRADDYSSLSYLDLVYGHGYRVYGKRAPVVFEDRDVVEYARALMPATAAYRVVVGPDWRPRWATRWSETLEADFLRYHLLPRDQADDATWVFCFSCDVRSLGRFEVLARGRRGLTFGRAR